MRTSFLPSNVRLLLIGESPPASGRFFYQRDSGLYRAARDAFQVHDSGIDDANFLEAFQASGCYLIDLCSEPVDRLDPKARRAACVAAEPGLAETIIRLQPHTIATIVRSIEGNVESAIAAAQWNGPILKLPYPGRWKRHREIFVDALADWYGQVIPTRR